MPELPEVETVVRGLAPRLPGHRVDSTTVLRPDILDGITPARFARTVKGKTAQSVTRRAKYIVIEMDGDVTLTVHLGMTGKLLFFGAEKQIRTSHLAVRWKLSDGARLAYDDVRRFGRVWAGPTEVWSARAEGIGPEPLDPEYRAEDLAAALANSASPVRSWLLDQKRIAGVGNIYANEALYLAGVRPTRPAHSVTSAEVVELHRGLRTILEHAIESGGTTLRDYRNADGGKGDFERELAVYGREGVNCSACSTTIERQVFGGRSAFLCPTCQR